MKMLRELTDVRTGLRAAAVAEEGLLCRDAEGNETLFPADSVLCAAGMRVNHELVDQLRGLCPQTEIIGDCRKPGMIRAATFRGYHAAMDL